MTKHPDTTTSNLTNIPLVLMGIAFFFVLTGRLQLLDIPLERDEGGYAYIGQHLFGSQRLYTDLLDIKLPGLYFLYWMFDLLPGSPSTRIHLGLLLLHSVALYFFYRLIRDMFHLEAARVATALFAISAALPGVYGFATHATQLLQAPLMLSLWLLWRHVHAEKTHWPSLALVGLLLGVAFTIKQPAIVFIVFSIAVLLLESRYSFLGRIGRAFVLGAASLVPFLAIAGYYWTAGRWDSFWRWTFEVPTAQTVGGDSWTYLKTLVPPMVGNHYLFWVGGVATLAILPALKTKVTAHRWVAGLLLCALLSAAIGLGYMPHYFIPAIPWAAAGIAAVLYAWSAQNDTRRMATYGLFIALPLLLNFGYFTRPDHLKIMENGYHWNGFAEIKAIGEQLKKRLRPGETIGVLGSEPQINYYTQTEHCSPHLFMYPVIRENAYQAEYQRQFLADFDRCKPAYLIVTASEASWMPGFANSDFFKNALMATRVTPNYTLIGRANIGQIPMSIVWDDALKTHRPPQCPPIFVFKRKI